MRFKFWKRELPAEVVELNERADQAEHFVDQAQAAMKDRAPEIKDSAAYFRNRRQRNHLTQLFEDLYGGRA